MCDWSTAQSIVVNYSYVGQMLGPLPHNKGIKSFIDRTCVMQLEQVGAKIVSHDRRDHQISGSLIYVGQILATNIWLTGKYLIMAIVWIKKKKHTGI